MCVHDFSKINFYICRARTRNLLFMSNINKIRIKDIAAMAGVSAGTIDRVLHNRGEVKEETRERIHQIVSELGYTPNLLAKSLASKRVARICILLPGYNNDNPYWEKPLHGINKAIAEIKDFHAEVDVINYQINSVDDFEKQSERLLDMNPDGIIFPPHFVDSSLKFIQKCSLAGVPVVFIDSNIENDYVSGYFGQDSVASGHLAARLMSYCVPTASSILIIKLTKNKATLMHLKKREQGFMEYIQSNPQLKLKTVALEIDVDEVEVLEKTLEKMLSEDTSFRGIFVTNARVHMAASALEKLNKRNILLVGYDLIDRNIHFLQNGTIDFLICQKPEEQGYRSVIALFNLLISKRPIERVNYSTIDIIMKENLAYYYKNKQ